MITPRKWQQLTEQMHAAGLNETDIVEKFILGSGRGGQKMHKTASCVYLKHLPSGIEIKCQDARSREDNRFFARRRLLEKFLTQILNKQTEAKHAQEKIRRQKKRRSRRGKLKMLDQKHHRATIKTLRKPPTEEG